MAESFQRTPLKQSKKRTVWLERSSEGPRVVKHFHDPSKFVLWRDRLRAGLEHRILKHLDQHGVRVPKILDLRRGSPGWELHMQWVPDSVGMDEILHEGAEWPASQAGFARELGRALAAVHKSGLDHVDLHPGNVLLDADGHAWLIDFHQARIAKRLTRHELERDLIALAGQCREGVTVRFRARVLCAWRKAMGAEWLKDFNPNEEWAAQAEVRARQWRREDGAWRPEAWMRALVRGETARSLSRIRRDCDFEGELSADASTSTLIAQDGGLAQGVALTGLGSRSVLIERGALDELAQSFEGSVRLFGHGLPVAEPLCLVPGKNAWAAYALPNGSLLADTDKEWTLEQVRSLGELIGGLHDRGLRCDRLRANNVALATDGKVLLLSAPHLESFDLPPSAGEVDGRFDAVSTLSAGWWDSDLKRRQAFESGYLSAFRSGSVELRELGAALGS